MKIFRTQKSAHNTSEGFLQFRALDPLQGIIAMPRTVRAIAEWPTDCSHEQKPICHDLTLLSRMFLLLWRTIWDNNLKGTNICFWLPASEVLVHGQLAGIIVSRLWGGRVDRRTQKPICLAHGRQEAQKENAWVGVFSPLYYIFPQLSLWDGAAYPHSGSVFYPWLMLFGNGLRTPQRGALLVNPMLSSPSSSQSRLTWTMTRFTNELRQLCTNLSSPDSPECKQCEDCTWLCSLSWKTTP